MNKTKCPPVRLVRAVAAACLLPTNPAIAQVIIDLSGEEWQQFGRVQKVAFDGAGQLYVFDRQVLHIHVVDGSGRLRRTLGGQGDGPGEFRRAPSFTVMPDGRVVVGDTGYQAYQIFDANGDYERRVGMGLEDVGGTLWDFMPDPAGDALFSAVGSRMLLFKVVRTAPSHTTRPIERLDLTGDVVTRDTVANGWLPAGVERLSSGSREPTEFGPRMLLGVLPDGTVAFSDSSAYAIKLVRPGAGVQRILRRPLQPVRVTNRMIEAEKDRQRQGPVEPGMEPYQRERIDGSSVLRGGFDRPRTWHQLGRRNLGAAARRGTDRRRRTDRCPDSGRAVPWQLPGGRDRDAGRLRPGSAGRVHRRGRAGGADRGGEAGVGARITGGLT